MIYPGHRIGLGLGLQETCRLCVLPLVTNDKNLGCLFTFLLIQGCKLQEFG